MPLWRNLIVQFQGLQPASSPTATCIHISTTFRCCSNWGRAEWQSLSRCNFLPLLYSDLTWQSAFLGAARTVHSFHDIGRDCSFHAAAGASHRFTVEQNVRFMLPSSSCPWAKTPVHLKVAPFALSCLLSHRALAAVRAERWHAAFLFSEPNVSHFAPLPSLLLISTSECHIQRTNWTATCHQMHLLCDALATLCVTHK